MFNHMDWEINLPLENFQFSDVEGISDLQKNYHTKMIHNKIDKNRNT